MNLNQWAIKWSVPYEALEDLRREMGLINTGEDALQSTGRSEAAVQAEVRLEASSKGCRLWRNNVGAFCDDSGQWVRYGLANDSPKMNKLVKSADLIGIKPVLIQAEHIGATIGQFVSREVKKSNWHYTGTEHEEAQLNWVEIINSLGGDACFATGKGSL